MCSRACTHLFQERHLLEKGTKGARQGQCQEHCRAVGQAHLRAKKGDTSWVCVSETRREEDEEREGEGEGETERIRTLTRHARSQMRSRTSSGVLRSVSSWTPPTQFPPTKSCTRRTNEQPCGSRRKGKGKGRRIAIKQARGRRPRVLARWRQWTFARPPQAPTASSARGVSRPTPHGKGRTVRPAGPSTAPGADRIG